MHVLLCAPIFIAGAASVLLLAHTAQACMFQIVRVGIQSMPQESALLQSLLADCALNILRIAMQHPFKAFEFESDRHCRAPNYTSYTTRYAGNQLLCARQMKKSVAIICRCFCV